MLKMEVEEAAVVVTGAHVRHGNNKATGGLFKFYDKVAELQKKVVQEIWRAE